MKISKDLTAQIVMTAGIIVTILTMIKFVQNHPIFGFFMVGGMITFGIGYTMYKNNSEE